MRKEITIPESYHSINHFILHSNNRQAIVLSGDCHQRNKLCELWPTILLDDPVCRNPLNEGKCRVSVCLNMVLPNKAKVQL